MTFYISPKHIITDFLRVYLTDPRSRAETSQSESFTVTDNDNTTFELSAPTGTVSCVTAVTSGGTDQTKWVDYYYDERNEQIIFFNAQTTGDTVTVTYKYGSTNWIYADKPDKRLSLTAFPRIDVLVVSGSGERLGNYEAPVQTNNRYQIDVWALDKMDGQIFTIDSKKYVGDKLAEYLAYKITEALEDNINDMHPVLYDYIPVGAVRDLKYDEEMQLHHKTHEFLMKCLNVGRIDT